MNIEVKKDLQRYTAFLLYWAAVILIAILLSASGSGGGMSSGSGGGNEAGKVQELAKVQAAEHMFKVPKVPTTKPPPKRKKPPKVHRAKPIRRG